MAPSHYQLSMELHELPANTQEELPDDMTDEEKPLLVNVELRLTGSVPKYKRIEISVREAVLEDYPAVFEILDALKELGVAASSHVSIIVNLIEFIDRCEFFYYSPPNIPMVIMTMEKVGTDGDDESLVMDENHVHRQVQEQRELQRVSAMATTTDDEEEDEIDFQEDEDDFDAATESMEVDTWVIKTTPASEAAIAGLEKIHRVESELCNCIICNEDGEEEFARMPCLHVFHTMCLITWLRTSGSCPLCRFQLPS